MMFILAFLLPLIKAEEFIFGSGCYWGRQFDFVTLEQQWKRSSTQITTVGGYFGGTNTNPIACYYNQHNLAVYSTEGHAEVIKIEIPWKQLEASLELYFASFLELSPSIYTREDYFDVGPGYRALIGFPGGIENTTVMNIIRKMDPHHTNFSKALGSDTDTLGLNQIWIYDTTESFTFHQAELCLQFHNNQTSTYPESYHAIKNTLIKDGRLHETKCPMPEIDSCL